MFILKYCIHGKWVNLGAVLLVSKKGQNLKMGNVSERGKKGKLFSREV